jgi:fructosamine-3-kinase
LGWYFELGQELGANHVGQQEPQFGWRLELEVEVEATQAEKLEAHQEGQLGPQLEVKAVTGRDLQWLVKELDPVKELDLVKGLDPAAQTRGKREHDLHVARLLRLQRVQLSGAFEAGSSNKINI